MNWLVFLVVSYFKFVFEKNFFTVANFLRFLYILIGDQLKFKFIFRKLRNLIQDNFRFKVQKLEVFQCNIEQTSNQNVWKMWKLVLFILVCLSLSDKTIKVSKKVVFTNTFTLPIEINTKSLTAKAKCSGPCDFYLVSEEQYKKFQQNLEFFSLYTSKDKLDYETTDESLFSQNLHLICTSKGKNTIDYEYTREYASTSWIWSPYLWITGAFGVGTSVLTITVFIIAAQTVIVGFTLLFGLAGLIKSCSIQ